MAGTKIGGLKAKMKNLKKDPEFYSKIGRIGGKNSSTGGFAAGEEGRKRASYYGRIGGTKSRKPKAKK